VLDAHALGEVGGGVTDANNRPMNPESGGVGAQAAGGGRGSAGDEWRAVSGLGVGPGAGVVREFGTFVGTRPDAAETAAVARVLAVARRTGVRVHVLHLSSAAPLESIRAARADGVRVSVETCPHYLVFSAEEVPDGATEFKCCPPIRSAANRELLWTALAEGLIGFVVSDHSPCTPDLKLRSRGDFAAAWGGIASVQLGLPAVWTEARGRGWALADVVEVMARRTAEFAGLPHKGRIAVGCEADLVVFDPDARFTVDAAALAHRNPVTPYHGRTLTGVVRATFLRGESVGEREAARGRLLRRVGGSDNNRPAKVVPAQVVGGGE